MSEQNNEKLSAFMKKQISQKASKNNSAKKSSTTLQAQNLDPSQEEDQNQEIDNQDMTEEEQLEEAKKASRNKASQRDQVEMFKKLLMENVAKYVLLVTILVVCSIGVIKIGPEIVNFFNGLIFRVMMGSLAG